MISLRSQIVRAVLGFLFANESASLYLNQIAREFDLDRGNLVRKLGELEREGILVSEMRGHQRYYSLNQKYPLYKEYRTIFQKTLGLEKEMVAILRQVTGVWHAWIFGSYAKGNMDAASDIDLLVVGRHDTIDLQRKIQQLQRNYGREINVISMSQKEFEQRKVKRDPFLTTIFLEKVTELL